MHRPSLMGFIASSWVNLRTQSSRSQSFLIFLLLCGCLSGAMMLGKPFNMSYQFDSAISHVLPRTSIPLARASILIGGNSFENIISEYIPTQEQVKVVVNVGARDGRAHDPTYSLMKEWKYRGVLFEGDPKFKDHLRRTVADITPEPTISWGYISTSDAVSRLRNGKVPKYFDALKIDIDSFDAQLADTILSAGYRPRVIMVEVNPDIPPPIAWHQLESNYFSGRKVGRGNYGASAAALYNILTKKHDYGVVSIELDDPVSECPRCEHNLWFVDGALLRRKSKSVPTLSDLSFAFWSAHLSATQYRCIHLRNPCPLYDFIELTDNSSTAVSRGTAFSTWLATDSRESRSAVSKIVNEISVQLKRTCSPEEGDLCRDKIEVLEASMF